MKLALSLGQIGDTVGGSLPSALDHSSIVHSIASLETATEHDLAVVFDPEDGSPFAPLVQEKIVQSAAGIILASRPVVAGKQYLIVADPLAALTTLTTYLYAQREAQASQPVMTPAGAWVSPTAICGEGTVVAAGVVIEDGAVIGKNCVIGAQVFIGKDVVIGDDVYLHPGVKILERTSIGSRCIIHANAVLGSDGFGYRITRRGLIKIPQIGTVTIGNYVEIGATATLDRAAFDATIIGDGVKIGNAVAISHNVIVGAGSAILAQTIVGGSVVIGRGCQIGAQVAIKDHISLGDGCRVVSTSGLLRDIKAGETVCGNPAVPFMDWKRMSVAATKLPEMMKVAAEVKPALEQWQKKSWLRSLIGM